MPRFVHSSRMPVPVEELAAWHERPGALERLLPPWQRARVERRGAVREGQRIELRLGVGPFPVRWVAEIRDVEPGRSFRDRQIEGPFARWLHTHRFLAEGEGTSRLEDDIEYALPFGWLGGAVAERWVRRTLHRSFRFRHARTSADLSRHAAFRDRAPWRVAVTGSSGLVGSQLVPFLETGGHRVDRLVRHARASGPGTIGWDPYGDVDSQALAGVDAVVHLAGEPITALRWTQAKRRAIRESRVRGTRTLAEALAQLDPPPRVFVVASAVGYYGDRGDERLLETSAPGSGFLPDVCQEWEAAAEPAARAGIRVVTLRTGLVLSAAGGSLASMLPVFRLGLGGPLGNADAFLSWIALDDLVGAIHFAMMREDMRGPVNAVSPHPVRQREFAETLGRVLGRPALLPVPAAAVRTALGDLGKELLLASTRVEPARLDAAGFRFVAPELEGAFRTELGRLLEPTPEVRSAA